MLKIKAIYRKNLKMSEGKVAAQVGHAVKNLGWTPPECTLVVLKVSDKKFEELTQRDDCYIQVDMGHTEVEKGTATAAAWIEDDYFPKNRVEWYTETEIKRWLMHLNYSEEIADELSPFITGNYMNALKKGYQLGRDDSRSELRQKGLARLLSDKNCECMEPIRDMRKKELILGTCETCQGNIKIIE